MGEVATLGGGKRGPARVAPMFGEIVAFETREQGQRGGFEAHQRALSLMEGQRGSKTKKEGRNPRGYVICAFGLSPL